MIAFKKIENAEPYSLLYKKYEEARLSNQRNIEAISISSYSHDTNEVDSRYVNLKIVDGKDFIFFSNYNSNKSSQFLSNNKIAALFFWNNINTQIRLKAEIFKLEESLSDRYFIKRQKEKNALAISSEQSRPIKSFELVKQNYLRTLKKDNLNKRPEYWGGYRFVPYEFEFWIGHEYRLNHRTRFKKANGAWDKILLQP